MNRPAPPPRPASLWPPGPWLTWGWRGVWVRGHTANQFLIFCLVGGSGVAVNTAVMWALYNLSGMPYVLASIGAFFAASINNFTWNKIFTFRDKQRGAAAVARQYLKFLSVTLLGLGVNLAVLVGLVELFAMHPLPANLAGIAVATFVNFLGNKLFAFRPVAGD